MPVPVFPEGCIHADVEPQKRRALAKLDLEQFALLILDDYKKCF